jgi:hypothetical protein
MMHGSLFIKRFSLPKKTRYCVNVQGCSSCQTCQALLRLCFGEVFGMGIPQCSHRPSPTNQTTYSRHGDNVNILHLSDDNEMEDGENPKFRERTAARGIEFYYDEAAGTLRLRIRYSRIALCNEVVKQVFPGAGIRLEGDKETTTMTTMMVQGDEDD